MADVSAHSLDNLISNYGDLKPYAQGSNWDGTMNFSDMKEFMQLWEQRAYDRDLTNSSRAWDEYFDSTKYQRAVKDLESAGLNKWLAVQSGVSGSGSASNSSPVHSAKYKEKESQKDKVKNKALDFVGSALKVLIAAALFA